MSAPRCNADWVAALSAGGAGRDQALVELRATLVKGLRYSLNRYGTADELAEDFAQEALIRICERLDTYRGDSRFTTWAMSVAMRIAMTELRRARWRDVSLDQMTEVGRVPETVDSSPVLNSLLDILRKSIETEISVRQRTVIEAELSGAPPDEIARRMGTTRNSLYKLLHDARAKMKAAILRAGWSEADVREVLSQEANRHA